ncbi:MAG: DUF5301 domain-containing protein [Anaerovoracaceae bacterium]|jgi:hypothetical protein
MKQKQYSRKAIVTVAILTVTVFFSMLLAACGEKAKTVDLPQASAVKELTVKQIDKKGKTTASSSLPPADVAAILGKISKADMTWKEESTDDGPMVKPCTAINISTADKDTRLYVYEKKGTYLLEQPYVGVWKISAKVYNMFAGDKK